ncbi:hypothetical protein SGRA_2502 [Saprospira grandis str. Lewin]|uniref:Uncharacterized protein n=1 Tax=Saprospira grandis (strain Lewin) TaxID=984262 RepID=H6L5L4_SAPGL|nr:hypothetical protein SGRA_2502 [Saprospira grandis str. Lewin]
MGVVLDQGRAYFYFGARGRLGFASLGRRYAAPLAGLLGPAAACGGFGLALRATAAQRWAK